MSRALLDRLVSDQGWSRLETVEAVERWTARPGLHCLFIPGDPAKNLETADVAIILPELVKTFRGTFDCALVADGIDRATREFCGVWPTPSLVFFREGEKRGAIPRVREWQDYIEKIGLVLEGRVLPNTELAAE